MKQGDFTKLAESYIHRTGYSEVILRYIAEHALESFDSLKIADVGAGTGKLTENLASLGYPITAVEPNDAMREEGKRYTSGKNVNWQKGSGEETGLETNSVNWLLMGSSFHWVDFRKGLEEFQRVLMPGGFFTAIWNPRNLEVSELHTSIENQIRQFVPSLKRVSSGSGEFTKTLSRALASSGLFTDVVYMEQEYDVIMSVERYMGAWHSTNDIQAQAGPETWAKIIRMIENEISGMKEIVVPYKTRAWTAKSLK
ncbi:MAG: class I SAM-dependent methyltransferase [Bacteroidetes bacterium]|jgi:ubiquinone/menaquinone biosynthesis C-methylase UbiE|nr:class I SAM-dependent methyltransferase [Bacteroidota bacterium]MBP6402054.1 class I SAM-dependent methyltransferase [Bacteroidia bacterium]MBP6650615.1 class I SAM-dependent methyltransferase [Bacteroidia bacterium]